ncbi:hypothetical protein Kfla_0287 [Kribbella flavida DSM 17836]|uniref:DUF3558 domain-containing protein n=1 Tax=Kribbella flavida (strain DSM 17836 / JCM 10339 / NBRC 14399) TaxID=479435 RepID=D2PT95_KRIFD|nr:hypothetical protein Kfla_0287 [Kribbella flavida DSM 17836]
MVRVGGVAGRVVRGTVIAAVVAVVVGLGIGFAAGEPVREDDILPARKLPADLCARLGDISGLLPKATEPVTFVQTGTTEVRCRAVVDESQQSTFTAATLDVRITPYAGRDGGAGELPFRPDQIARKAFDRQAGKVVPDRPYPTKIQRTGRTGGQDWLIGVVVLRGDIVVHVDYAAYPVTAEKAEQAALVLADRAIWETK